MMTVAPFASWFRWQLSFRVSRGEAQDMAGALPPTLREIVQPCAVHRAERPDIFGRVEFLETLAQHLQITIDQGAAVARAVFSAIQTEMPIDEVMSVEGQLPSDLQQLWSPHLHAA